jgi:hypothetical protein
MPDKADNQVQHLAFSIPCHDPWPLRRRRPGDVFRDKIHANRVGRRVLIPKTEVQRLAERQ